MQKRHFITTLYLLVLFVASAWAQKNTLTIPDVTVAQGKSIALPINMDNTADIVAVQFTVTVSDGITLSSESAKVSERSNGHTLTMRPMGNNKYMVMAFSGQNTPFTGRSGHIMTVSLNTSSSLAEGTKLPLTLSDVVIADKTGKNLATGFTSGSVSIAKSADLEVSNVTTTACNVTPNGKMTIAWQVSNIGGLATENGWSEQVFLESLDGFEKLIGTIDYDKKLVAGGSISRSADFDVPEELGISHQARIWVKIKPYSNTGEPSWLLTNNEANSAQTVQVVNKLFVNPNVAHLEEANVQNVRFKLTRSGSTAEAETFKIVKQGDDRLEMPAEIVIPQGQSGTYFYAKVNPNGILDNDSTFSIGINGNDYEATSMTITMEDDTYPKLTLSSVQQDVTEGGTLTITIDAERVSAYNKPVTLSCDMPARFKIPSNIILAKGKSKVDVTVEALEDDIPDVEKVVTFAASAEGYQNGTMLTTLVDDDIPALQLEMTPNAISEGDGPLAVTATLKRTSNIDKKVTIKLSDDSNGGIYYARQVIEMQPGEKEAVINLGPIDNNTVDGERTYHVTAAVFIASCSCNASAGTSGGVVTAPLTIYDNDGPSLSMTSASSYLKEGGEMTLTVSRNTDNKGNLQVSISSNQDASLEYPKTVVIPDGKASSSFTVKSKSNSTTGDDLTVTLTAMSEGYAKSNVWFTVSDQTLPDGKITEITSDKTQVEAGEEIVVKVDIANVGNAILPEQTKIGLYLDNASTASATTYLQDDLAAGGNTSVSLHVAMPNTISEHKLYAVINDGKDVKELLYTNNTSQVIDIKTVSPFTMSATTNKAIYQQGEKVTITGKASGKDTGKKNIEVYVVNNGYRHVISVETMEDGSFKTSYEPFKGQMGHFSVGACYPTENLSTEMASFNIYGIKTTNNSAVTCEASLGDVYEGKLNITNPGTLPLTGLKVKVTSQPENCQVSATLRSSLNGGENTDVNFTITPKSISEGTEWEKVNLEIESAEGATFSTTLYYYIRNKLGKLEASVNRINTTMVKGESRDYPFTISNIGKGETGKITLALPSWMTSVTPMEMASLAKDESVEVILRMTPTEKMQLNVPVTGSIGINCQNGEGMSLPFYIEPVSTSEGTMTIDVCDENTYYTKEAPHLAGATVTVTHPTTGAAITSGTTNDKGIFTVNLPEGYYAVNVTADKHDSYRNNILVDPGKDNKTTVNLSISAIKVSYDVVETEVEDQYEIVTTTKFVTNVPRPVVVASAPKSLNGDDMRVGESAIFNFILTNKGLINAENVKLWLPTTVTGWEFKALEDIEVVTLSPQCSKSYPIQVTRIDETKSNSKFQKVSSDSPMAACMAGMEYEYAWRCGRELKEDESLYRMALKTCAHSAIMEAVSSAVGGSFGGFGGGGTGPIGPSNGPIQRDDPQLPPEEKEQVINTYDPLCDPNRTKCGEELLNQLFKRAPGIGPILDKINTAADKAISAAENGGTLPPDELMDLAKDLAEEASDAIKDGDNGLKDLADDLEDVLESCQQFILDQNQRDKVAQSKKAFGVRYSFVHAMNLIISRLRMLDRLLLDFYGHRVWYCRYNSEKAQFFEYLKTLPSLENINEKEMLEHKPSMVTKEHCYILIEHLKKYWNNTNVWKDTKEEIAPYLVDEQNAVELGYASFDDLFRDKLNEAYKEVTESSGSVCSSITLQFTQQMVMTRQAFRGTLTVFNGHETTAMKDVKLNLTVTDELGNIAMSDKFQVNLEKLDDFNGELNFSNGWSLDAQKTGVATVLFIPTKHAAPQVETRYAFGGSISYIDPFTGLEVTRQLSPITLTVKPSPSLDLTYFMQRDVLGDDPLTKDVVEPSEEAEFSLLINNVGNGDASNVRMTTHQPEVIANEKGLHINFELMSSQLNGQDKTLALGESVATDFGNIPAKGTSYAQWWFKSSLLGHFTEYDVKATHLSSYGNKDLSLLNDVNIHELIRSIDVTRNDKMLKGFMTNDIVDANDTPDMLYLSDGEIEKVNVAAKSSITKTSSTEYKLTIAPTEKGWNYGNLPDPTYGVSAIKSIRRENDGMEMSLRNFWQTDRTLRDGKDPLYENRIHFVDEFKDKEPVNYILTFEPTPELLLEVASIEGTPNEGEVAYQPVDKLKVMFNKHIDPSTFTSEDIKVAVQGKDKDSKLVNISTDDNKSFVLDLTRLNENAENGYYTLTVQTAGVTDAEGYQGKVGKTADWIMFKDGQVKFITSAYPQGSGDIEYTTVNINGAKALAALAKADEVNNALYGSTIQLTAKPKDGYVFSFWSLNGETISTEETIEQTVLGDLNYVANFSKKTYDVKVDEQCVGGTIANTHTGIYSHGDQLELTAVADEDYSFSHWTVNGKKEGNQPTLTLTIDKDYTVTASFKKERYEQSITLMRGWNWISSYLAEPVSNSDIDSKSSQLIGSEGAVESLLPAKMYKVKATTNFIARNKGKLFDNEMTPISLKAGWNWMGYPLLEQAELSSVIVSAENGDYIVGQSGFSQYHSGTWEGTLNILKPNAGYLYKSASDKNLKFEASTAPSIQEEEENAIDYRQYSSTMNIIGSLTKGGQDISSDDHIVYAMVGNEKRGISKLVNGKYYLTIYGEKDEKVSLLYEDVNSQETYLSKQTLTFTEDVLGSRNLPFEMSLDLATGIDNVFDESANLKIYSIDGYLIDNHGSVKTLEKLPKGIYIINGSKYVIP